MYIDNIKKIICKTEYKEIQLINYVKYKYEILSICSIPIYKIIEEYELDYGYDEQVFVKNNTFVFIFKNNKYKYWKLSGCDYTFVNFEFSTIK
jgi:hypothetical protein